MSEPNLTTNERAAVLKPLRDGIAADRHQLSPRIQTLKSALSKLVLWSATGWILALPTPSL